MAMQGLVRRGLAAALQSGASRGLAAGQQRAMSGAASYGEEVAQMKRWKLITFVSLPILPGLYLYLMSKGHHHATEQPEYSYLHVRSKEYPWGKCDLFEKFAGRCTEN